VEPFQGERLRPTVEVLVNRTTDTFGYDLETVSSLPPGDYTINVKVPAPDGSGVVNAETVPIYIRR